MPDPEAGRPGRDGAEWKDAVHVARYLKETLPNVPSVAGAHEDVVRELIDANVRRVLDLGCGDGRLLAIALQQVPQASCIGVDFSEPMLALARRRFAGDSRVQLVTHDLGKPLPDLGAFDLVVSGFAIHHLDDARKREIYCEILARLDPGGCFINVEHVASSTANLHAEWMRALGITGEDPSNKCVPVEIQLDWLRDLGFEDVDCLWKWREMALMVGSRPA